MFHVSVLGTVPAEARATTAARTRTVLIVPELGDNCASPNDQVTIYMDFSPISCTIIIICKHFSNMIRGLMIRENFQVLYYRIVVRTFT